MVRARIGISIGSALAVLVLIAAPIGRAADVGPAGSSPAVRATHAVGKVPAPGPSDRVLRLVPITPAGRSHLQAMPLVSALVCLGVIGRFRRRVTDAGADWRSLLLGAPPFLQLFAPWSNERLALGPGVPGRGGGQVDIQIREQRLPGIGHRYELVVDRHRRLTVVVQDRGHRELGIVSGGADEPDVVVSLTQEQAVALAALLTGARFSIDTTEDDPIDAGEVGIETVTLGPSSPAVGRPMKEVRLVGDPEAAVLAVIRDDTPELIEHEEGRRCQPGDRVVIAARRDRLPAVIEQLAGTT
jgi:K+/H+ antiporter YhaU regulatory subunit KhtT